MFVRDRLGRCHWLQSNSRGSLKPAVGRTDFHTWLNNFELRRDFTYAPTQYRHFCLYLHPWWGHFLPLSPCEHKRSISNRSTFRLWAVFRVAKRNPNLLQIAKFTKSIEWCQPLAWFGFLLGTVLRSEGKIGILIHPALVQYFRLRETLLKCSDVTLPNSFLIYTVPRIDTPINHHCPVRQIASRANYKIQINTLYRFDWNNEKGATRRSSCVYLQYVFWNSKKSAMR